MPPSLATPVRIGVLGASSIAPSAVVEPAAARQDVEVVSVAARRAGAAEAFAARWGIARAETTYEAVVEDPDVDVVYVSMAASEHPRWAIAALRAGKDVLCEKPAALTVADATAMADAAESSGRLLVEAFHSRWHPLFRRVQQIVGSEGFGPIERMSSTIIGSRPFVEGSVLHDPALGGGALRHSGCYAVHWMRLLVGAEPRVVAVRRVLGLAGADASSELELVFEAATGRVTSSFARGRADDDPPELVVESATSRIEVAGLIVPQNGYSLRVSIAGELMREVSVVGRSSYDHQLDAFLAARGDASAAASLRRDLVAQAAVLDAAEAIGR